MRSTPGIVWQGSVAKIQSLRVREETNLHFQESRRTHGKARGGRIASYLTDEQRSQAGWIGASKCEVIFERALNDNKGVYHDEVVLG